MNRSRLPFLVPPRWTTDQLERDRLLAEEAFRIERMEEPLEEYIDQFERVRAVFEDLIETTVDLQQIDERFLAALGDRDMLGAIRYLTGPPISEDDLKTLADTNSLNPGVVTKRPEVVARVVQLVMTGLDRQRFPWVADRREPTEAERSAAILASAALWATQRTATARRTLGKSRQEGRVRLALLSHGFAEVPARSIRTLSEAPSRGEFCGESLLGERKADLIVGLWDGRVAAVECKVSNSSTNSVKRLNNDAAVKAETWITDFGTRQVVPVAILGGVYKTHNLEQAQSRGLALIWAHRLSDLTAWIGSTGGEMGNVEIP